MANYNNFDYIRVRSVAFWMILSFILIVIITGIVTEILGMKLEVPLEDTIFGILFYFVISVWIIWKFKSKNIDYKKIIGKFPANFKWWWITGIVILLILFSMGSYWLQYYPLSFVAPSYVNWVFSNEKEFYTIADTTSPLLYNFLMILIGVIIAPIVEELLFRGVMLHRFALKWGTTWAVLVSSFIFGIFHSDILGAFVFGFFMSILYIKSRTLLVPIACHVLNNTLVFGFVILEIVTEGGETVSTVTQFQSDLWMGMLFLLVSSPFVIYYMYKNWPKNGPKLPYFRKGEEKY